MNNLTRHITGYFIGISIFGLLIPYGLIKLSTWDPFIIEGLPAYLTIRIVISLPFFITGLFFVIWSNLFLFTIGKGGPADGFNIAISPRTKKLVVTGPYRYCRNPMVFGAFSVFFSIGLFMLSIVCLIALIIFLGLVVKYLKITEEKRLLKDFGDEYVDYKNSVPMIFPKISGQ